ncbi:hypothetical protein Dimus_013866 [Dionaea muscipula]
MPSRWLNVSKAFQKNPLVLEKLQPTVEEMEQWYWMGIDVDITQGFVYAPPRMLIHLLIRKLRKVVADDVAVVADDVAATSVKVAYVADKDLDVHVATIVADVGVMDVAGTDVPKLDDVALNELHTPDRSQIPDSTDPGSVRSVRVVSEGMIDFNASNNMVHEFLTRPYINITLGETNQIIREQLHQFIADQRDSRYVGMLEYADAKFFATLIGEEAQLDSMHIDAYLIYLEKRIMHNGGSEYAVTDSYFFTHVSELFENWNQNFHEIPQHVVTYVSGIRPDWGSEWWKVRHVLAVCLVAQSHWVSAHINLEKWTNEIYDSLAHKTPTNPELRLASFAGMRMLLLDILDEGEYFKHSGRERRIESFKEIRIPPKKVGKQEDEDSCGIWALHFTERLIAGKAIN